MNPIINDLFNVISTQVTWVIYICYHVPECQYNRNWSQLTLWANSEVNWLSKPILKLIDSLSQFWSHWLSEPILKSLTLWANSEVIYYLSQFWSQLTLWANSEVNWLSEPIRKAQRTLHSWSLVYNGSQDFDNIIYICCSSSANGSVPSPATCANLKFQATIDLPRSLGLLKGGCNLGLQ